MIVCYSQKSPLNCSKKKTTKINYKILQDLLYTCLQEILYSVECQLNCYISPILCFSFYLEFFYLLKSEISNKFTVQYAVENVNISVNPQTPGKFCKSKYTDVLFVKFQFWYAWLSRKRKRLLYCRTETSRTRWKLKQNIVFHDNS